MNRGCYYCKWRKGILCFNLYWKENDDGFDLISFLNKQRTNIIFETVNDLKEYKIGYYCPVFEVKSWKIA